MSAAALIYAYNYVLMFYKIQDNIFVMVIINRSFSILRSNSLIKPQSYVRGYEV